MFKIRKPSSNEDALQWIRTAMIQILVHLTMSVTPSDKIGFTFSSESFKMKIPGWMSFRDASQVTFDDVWNVLGSIFQSNTEDALDINTFRITATIVKMPQGRGRQLIYNNFHEECRARLGIVQIKNEDSLCLPRAIVVAKAFAKKDPQYQQIRKDVRKIQTQKTEKLMKKVGIIIGENGAGVAELQLFQTHLKKYKISVYKYGTKGRELIFEGPEAQLKINLLYLNGHYNVITSLTSAFGCTYYCQDCHVPYANPEHHRCGKLCPACQKNPPCALTTENIECSECNRKFRGAVCFNNHLLKMCNTVKRCMDIRFAFGLV